MSHNFGHDTTAEEIVQNFPGQIKGRTFAITGTSAGGLGGHAAIALSREAPAHLILISRTRAKVEPVISEISSINSSVKVSFVECSLEDLDSVRKAAHEINTLTPNIDVLINNAGVMAISKRTLNKQGIEMTQATNHIGHFLLTKLLLPQLVEASKADSNNKTGPSQPPRIINLTSRGHRISPFLPDDPNFTGIHAYDPWTSYGQSKTSNILFTTSLNKSSTLQQHRIRSFAVHPGGIFTTGLTTHLGQTDFDQIATVTRKNTGGDFGTAVPKNLTQGTSSILWAALDPTLDELELSMETLYINDCNFEPCREYASDSIAAGKLWTWSESVIGEKFDI